LALYIKIVVKKTVVQEVVSRKATFWSEKVTEVC